MVTGQVNCERVRQEISNYLDGEVDSALRGAMDAHFHACNRCTSVLEGTRNVIRLYGDERMIEAPAGFGRRLEKRLARSAHGGNRWSVWSTWLVPVAAVALIAGSLRVANSLTTGEPLKSEHAQAGQNIPPDMMVVVAADTKVFHAAGCTFIHNKEKLTTLTAKEAMRQGYVPCLRCMRKDLETAEAGHGAPAEWPDLDADADEDRGSGGQ